MISKYVYGFACLSAALAIHTVATTLIVRMEPTEWGIMTELPSSFWIGLLSLFIFMYIGRRSTSCTVVSLLLTMVYLFVVPTLIVENPTYGPAYYPFSEGLSVADRGRLIEDPGYPVAGYHDVPLYLYLVAVVTISTRIPSLWLLKCFPILQISLIGLFVYLILRTRFAEQRALQGATYFLASSWFGFSFFSPQSMGFVIFLEIFLLVSYIFFREDVRNNLRVSTFLILILFFALTLTHGLTTVFMVSAIATMYALRIRKGNRTLIGMLSCMLFITIWLACLNFFSSSFLERAVTETLKTLSDIEAFITFQTARVRFSGSIYQASTLVSRLLSSSIVVTIVLFALVKNRRRIGEVKYWLSWLIAFCLPIAASSYGAEMIIRVYMFALIPLTYISVAFLASRPKIFSIIVIVLIFLNMPANYGGLSVELVPTSTLAGTSFYAKNSMNDTYFVSSNTWRILLYYEPPLVKIIPRFLILQKSPETASEGYIKVAMQNSTYIVDSDPTRNMLYFYYGTDLLQKLHLDDKCSRIYDNDGFQIFANSQADSR